MLIFISSPYAGDIEKNTKAARSYCRYAVERGHNPIAPHLLYPQFLDENSSEERDLGLKMGLEILDKCDEMWCFGDPSPGMTVEISHAEKRSIPIRYFTADAGKEKTI